MEALERALLAAVLLAAGFGAYHLATRLLLARLRGRRLGLESLRPGIPAILYFTTPTCAPCKTVQRPALAEVKTALDGGVQIIEIDCIRRPDLADYWGVLSVPTTFIIDPLGRPRLINHGVTRAEKLLAQIENLNEKRFDAKARWSRVRN